MPETTPLRATAPGRRPFDAVVFDLDGVIVDTERVIHDVWSETFARYGASFTPEEWATAVGTAGRGFDPPSALAERSDGGAADAQRSCSRRCEHAERLLLDELSPLPGIREWIESAKRLGMQVAIASSSPAIWVEGRLADVGLDDYFVVLSCRNDELPAKPEPDLYLDACSRLGVEPDRAVAVEDSANGLAAARAAGLRSVAVPNSMTRDHDLSSADLLVDSLAAVPLEEALRRLTLAKAVSPRRSTGGLLSRHDEDRKAAPPEELAGYPSEMEMGVRRATHDDQVGPAGLREYLELRPDVTVTAGEVATDLRPEELLGHKAGQALVALGVRDQAARERKTADGGRSGEVGHEAGVHTALLAHRQADRHGEGAKACLRTVESDNDAVEPHRILLSRGRHLVHCRMIRRRPRAEVRTQAPLLSTGALPWCRRAFWAIDSSSTWMYFSPRSAEAMAAMTLMTAAKPRMSTRAS